MLTGEMLYKAFWVSAPSDEINVTWVSISKQGKARYAAIAVYLNTALIDDGAAERDALRGQISQLHAQINELTDTVLRVEAERDAYQQIAQAKGGSDV